MAATVTVLAAVFPQHARSGAATLEISAGDDYTAGGEPLLALVRAALEAHFGVAFALDSVSLPSIQLPTAGPVTYDYDPEADLLMASSVTPAWSDPIAVAGDVGPLPADTISVLAVEATAGVATGHKAIEQAAGPAIAMTAAWSDAIAVASHVGDVPVGTVAIQAVEATAGTTTGPVTILHSAAGATQCNVDVGAGNVTFAAGDAVSEMRCLICSQPHPGAVEIDYTAGTVTFDVGDGVTEMRVLYSSFAEVADGTDLSALEIPVVCEYVRTR